MANRFVTAWKNRKKILEDIKNSIFRNSYSENVAKARKAICEACPHIDREGTTCMVPGNQPCCKLCGCSLFLKHRSLSSACDDKRWEAVMTQEEEDKLNY